MAHIMHLHFLQVLRSMAHMMHLHFLQVLPVSASKRVEKPSFHILRRLIARVTQNKTLPP